MTDVSGAAWRKSSHSGGNNDCVEMARGTEAALIRDSKNPSGPVLRFPVATLSMFLDIARASRVTG